MQHGADGEPFAALAANDPGDGGAGPLVWAAGGHLLWDMLDQSPDVIVCYDAQLRRTYANATYERYTGQASRQYLGRTVGEYSVVGAATGEMEQCLRRALSTGQTQRLDFEWHSPEGTAIWHALRVSTVRNAEGQLVGLVSMARDITERKQAEQQQAERERQFRALVENSPDYIVRYDRAGQRLYVNPSLRQLLSGPEMALGRAPAQGSPIVEAARYQRLIEEVVDTGKPRQAELLARLSDGSERWIDVRFCPETDEHGEVVTVLTVGRDVTEAVALRDRFATQARTDPLTGLGNRQAVFDHGPALIAEARRYERRVGVMVLDIDHFKEVNDTLGHHAGDQLLQQIAGRLAACTREYDLLARLGGDEFVVLVPSLDDVLDMAIVAARLEAALSAPLDVGGQVVHSGASVGVAVFPQDGASLDELLAHADLAMYQAKRGGRGRCEFYREAFTAQARRRVELAAALREARDGAGLALYYQPQVHLDTGVLSGAEALLRWRHPVVGMVPPDQFIPLAEESGLIVPIGRWVLREAALAAVRWNRGRSTPLRVAINVSVQQFVRDDLVAAVVQTLSDSGCQPHWLTIEVTESLLLEDSTRVLEAMRELARLGVRIEIDDFGTGYSALGYLARFDVHCLKIDRSFTRDITVEPRQRELLKAFILIAQSLKLDVIAEGVETVEQAKFLLANGCRHGQGYLFGQPLPTDGFERDWLDGLSMEGAGTT